MKAKANGSKWLQHLKRFVLPVARIGLVLLMSYVLAYFALMDCSRPAASTHPKVNEGFLTFHSSYRWANWQAGHPEVTDWNYLFVPLDDLYFWIFPSQTELWRYAEEN
jgi:hypothetical protein